MDEALKNQVIEILEEEQNQLDGALDNQSDILSPETLTQYKIEQDPDTGLWSKSEQVVESGIVDGSVDQANRSGVKKKAETLREFCAAVDNQILSFNAEIDVKKQQIVSLSTEATNGNCWPGIGYSATTSSGTTRNTVSAASSSFITSTVDVNDEIENIKIYPKMAGPDIDYNAQNVFEPDTIYTLSGNYLGYGYKNLRDPRYFKSNDGGPGTGNTDGSGSDIGTGRFDISSTLSDHQARNVAPFFAYPGAGVAPEASNTSVTPARCVAIASSISSIYNEILELRKQRDSLRSDLNTIKENKRDKELASWGISRMENESSRRKTANESAIAAVKSFNSDGTINVTGLIVHLDAGDSNSYSGVGTAWNDISGNGNNATLFPTGSPASYDYSNGGFLTFNGTDEYAETITKSTALLGTGDWTIESWFRVNGAPSDTTAMNVIVDTNPTGGTANMLHVTYGNVHPSAGLSTNRVAYSSRPTAGTYTDLVGAGVTNGLWYHGVVVRNGTTNTKLYLNGKLVNTFTGNVGTTGDTSVRIARWTDGTSFSNVSISVVKIYTKAYTDSEILTKFNGSKNRYTLLG